MLEHSNHPTINTNYMNMSIPMTMNPSMLSYPVTQSGGNYIYTHAHNENPNALSIPMDINTSRSENDIDYRMIDSDDIEIERDRNGNGSIDGYQYLSRVKSEPTAESPSKRLRETHGNVLLNVFNYNNMNVNMNMNINNELYTDAGKQEGQVQDTTSTPSLSPSLEEQAARQKENIVQHSSVNNNNNSNMSASGKKSPFDPLSSSSVHLQNQSLLSAFPSRAASLFSTNIANTMPMPMTGTGAGIGTGMGTGTGSISNTAPLPLQLSLFPSFQSTRSSTSTSTMALSAPFQLHVDSFNFHSPLDTSITRSSSPNIHDSTSLGHSNEK
jgi:hypothetical protein